MSTESANESSTPATLMAINDLVARISALERQPTAWTRGDIKLWYRPAADLPYGWYPCDGTAAPDGVVTPDLRGRFPVGLKASDAAFDTLGETGGSANLQHAHTGAPHDHSISHDHSITDVSGPVGAAGGTIGDGVTDVNGTGAVTVADDQHEHLIDITPASSVSGAAAAGNTGTGLSTTQYPPYAVVTFAYRYL